MKKTIFIISLWIGVACNLAAQNVLPDHSAQKLRISKYCKKHYTAEYLSHRDSILNTLDLSKHGHFGQWVQGTISNFSTNDSLIAFTFDACNGLDSSYNVKLIHYLQQAKISATLFVSGTWIEANPIAFKQLCRDTLFEIGCHGMFHRVCSLNGATVYNLLATQNAKEVYDEIEMAALAIEKASGRRPRFFRPPSAYIDETSCKIANALGLSVITYNVLSGDAMPFADPAEIVRQVNRQVKPGSIIIMHFNHPSWFTEKAMRKLVPVLKKKGYHFVKLSDCELLKN